jgi:hypothetical protein
MRVSLCQAFIPDCCLLRWCAAGVCCLWRGAGADPVVVLVSRHRGLSPMFGWLRAPAWRLPGLRRLSLAPRPLPATSHRVSSPPPAPSCRPPPVTRLPPLGCWLPLPVSRLWPRASRLSPPACRLAPRGCRQALCRPAFRRLRFPPPASRLGAPRLPPPVLSLPPAPRPGASRGPPTASAAPGSRAPGPRRGSRLAPPASCLAGRASGGPLPASLRPAPPSAPRASRLRATARRPPRPRRPRPEPPSLSGPSFPTPGASARLPRHSARAAPRGGRRRCGAIPQRRAAARGRNIVVQPRRIQPTTGQGFQRQRNGQRARAAALEN